MTRLPRPPGRVVRRALRRHRRPLAALCAALAVWAAVHALAPPAPPTALLTVAARDLAAGAVLGPSDLATVPVPLLARPDGATAPAAGRVLAAPMRRGEPFTDVRLAGSGRPSRPPGSVVVTIRTADPAAVLAVRPGDRVDVLAGPASESGVLTGATAGVTAGGGSDQGPAFGTAPVGDATVARGLVVLAVPGARSITGPEAGTGYGTDGAAGSGGDGGTAGGLLGGSGATDAGAPIDTAGVLVVAADRSAAARLATTVGRSLTVAVISP